MTSASPRPPAGDDDGGTGGRPRVRVVALGGTIAMTGDADRGVSPSLDADALLDAVPALRQVAELQAESFRQLPGAHLRLADLVDLAHHLRDADADGVVVTQGTDTLEETAFAVDLLYGEQAPVVFTGALRNPTLPGADGPANLLAAVRIAACRAARDQGVLVTFDDTVHAARLLRKGHTSKPSAFVSASAGPVGWIAEDRVRLPLAVRRRVHVPLERGGDLPRVALVTIALGDDGSLLDAAAAADGVVVEAFGVGHVPDWLVDRLAAIAADRPVVFASRTGAGESHRATYGFEGSERDLLGRGLVGAGALDGPKARVLLTLALAAGWSRSEIVAAIDTLSGG